MSPLIVFALIIQLISSGAILGVLWYLQLVHYPLLKKVKDNFTAYETLSVRKILFFMTPWIILDVLVNVILALNLSSGFAGIIMGIILALSIFTWLMTFFFQIDIQQELLSGFSLKSLKSVIRSSLIRTIIWSFKVALLVYYVFIIHSS